jgi:dienelactone hydrolase
MKRLFGLLALGAALSNGGCRTSPPHEHDASPAQSAAAAAVLADPVEITFPSEGRTLHGTLYLPAVPGRAPVVVYNHGSERDPGPRWLGRIGKFFQKNGFVAFMPYRRGAGGSEGPYWKDAVDALPAAARDAATVAQLDAESADVVEAVHWIRGQPFADPAAISVAGCSFGGIHTLVAAAKPLGLRAAVDFAGASMTWATNTALRGRLTRAAEGALTPVFFLQAENDFDTTPSRVLSAAMLAAGKPARVKIYPPQGSSPMEGHAGFCTRGQGAWGDDVLAFLRNPPK